MTHTDGAPLKTCSKCGLVWVTLRDLVLDGSIEVNGYQAGFDDPDCGLVLVTDKVTHCRTTLGIEVGQLRPLYDGPGYTQRRTGTEQCHGYCLHHEQLELCDADCELAWARQALQWLRLHKLPPHME